MKSKIQSDSNNEMREKDAAHASFLLQKAKTLILNKEFQNYSTWHYFSHLVLRNPGDLFNHTRRVFICSCPTLRPYLAGALHDLFLVLGPNGFTLRSRLLESRKPLLADQTINYFQRWITKQALPPANPECFTGSVLSKNTLGINQSEMRLVRKKRTLSNGYITVLQEVEDRIAQGQIGIAKTLLEDTLLDHPANTRLKNKLIEIYRHEHNWEAVDALSE